MSPVIRVCMGFAVVVEGNGDTNDKSIWEGQISVRVPGVKEKYLNHKIRVQEQGGSDGLPGRTIKWVSKSRGREQFSIEWKLGIRDDGYVPGQVTYSNS